MRPDKRIAKHRFRSPDPGPIVRFPVLRAAIQLDPGAHGKLERADPGTKEGLNKCMFLA